VGLMFGILYSYNNYLTLRFLSGPLKILQTLRSLNISNRQKCYLGSNYEIARRINSRNASYVSIRNTYYNKQKIILRTVPGLQVCMLIAGILHLL